MSTADEIRNFALEHYIEPARAQGMGTITLRAGEVHKAMGLIDRMPNVCSALGTAKFEQLAGVRLIQRLGPAQGSTARFTFEIAAQHPAPGQAPSEGRYAGSPEYLLVYAELIAAARYRGVTTYQAVAQIMGLPLTGTHMGVEVGNLIGEISRQEVALSRPMLSALVVGVGGKPGGGFFDLARRVGRLNSLQPEVEQAFWENEREAAYEAWKRRF